MRISVNEDPNPVEEFLAVVDYREARLCEDYILIEHDLDDAIFFAERALSTLEARPLDMDSTGHFDLPREVARAFEADWIAAIVKYYRCFVDGVRSKLHPSFFEKYEGAATAHQYFLDLRSKHVVHAINGFEQAVIFVVLPPKGTANPKVLDVGGLVSRRVAESPENTQAFLKLAKLAKVEVGRLFEDAQRSVFQRAASEAIENLYARPYASITATGGSDGAIQKRPSRPRGWQRG